MEALKKHVAIVVEEKHDSGGGVAVLDSDTPIDMSRLVRFYGKARGFNWDKDIIAMYQIEELSLVDLDKEEKENEND